MLRLFLQDGHRAPHKPLLTLLALGRLATSDSSAVPWSVAEHALAALIAEFGQPSRTGRARSAAYPFTRLRSDGIGELDADVPMDKITPLSERNVTGRLTSPIESALRASPGSSIFFTAAPCPRRAVQVIIVGMARR